MPQHKVVNFEDGSGYLGTSLEPAENKSGANNSGLFSGPQLRTNEKMVAVGVGCGDVVGLDPIADEHGNCLKGVIVGRP